MPKRELDVGLHSPVRTGSIEVDLEFDLAHSYGARCVLASGIPLKAVQQQVERH